MTEPDPATPLIEKQSPEVGALLQELRARVMDAIPQLHEKVHMGWGVIHYGRGEKMRDMIVALVPHRSHVNLEFADGVDLPDPAGRLEGTGKRLRHIKIRSGADAQHPDVRAILEAQARHP